MAARGPKVWEGLLGATYFPSTIDSHNVGVMLIPTEQSKREAYNSMPSGVTNEQGSFVVSGAPGEYFVIVWRLGEKAPTRDADSIKKFSASALRVALGPGERKSMDLVK